MMNIPDEQAVAVWILTWSDVEHHKIMVGRDLKTETRWKAFLRRESIGEKTVCCFTVETIEGKNLASFCRKYRSGRWHKGEGPYYDPEYDPDDHKKIPSVPGRIHIKTS